MKNQGYKYQEGAMKEIYLYRIDEYTNTNMFIA